jgi:hypothetical protein
MGTFNPITWASSLFLATLINTGLESLVYRFLFKLRISKSVFWKIFAINLVSVGAAFIWNFIHPVDY